MCGAHGAMHPAYLPDHPPVRLSLCWGLINNKVPDRPQRVPPAYRVGLVLASMAENPELMVPVYGTVLVE